MRSALILLGFLAACSAPKEPTPEERAAIGKKIRERLVKLHEELNLTADQQRAVKPILQAHREQMMTAFNEAKAGGRNMRTARRLRDESNRIWKESEAKLKPHLSDQQMNDLARARKQIRELMRNSS
jgi:acyl-CoA reductase-like NAD-dependent aldehyde dehydrogenase